MKEQEPHINTNPEDLIVDYLNNDITVEEKRLLEDWIAADDENKKKYYELTEIWIASQAFGDKNNIRSDAAYRRIRTNQRSRHRWMPYLKASAAIVGGLIILASGYFAGNKGKDSLLMSSIQTFEAPMGSRSKTVLPDGTTVWLNSGSRLTYSSGFANLDRKVELIGQGYFEVEHNKKLPFVVATDDINVKVLGTKFDVKAYRDDQYITVALQEGSIEFIENTQPDSSFIVKPLEMIVYDKETKSITKSKAPYKLAGHWVSGANFFYEMTLGQIAKQQEKTFEVKIEFDSEEKKELKYYADFNEDYSVEDILDMISITGRIKYEKHDTVIRIY